MSHCCADAQTKRTQSRWLIWQRRGFSFGRQSCHDRPRAVVAGRAWRCGGRAVRPCHQAVERGNRVGRGTGSRGRPPVMLRGRKCSGFAASCFGSGATSSGVPGGLKLVGARALGTLDLPPFPSLDSFAEGLDPLCRDRSGRCDHNIVTRGPTSSGYPAPRSSRSRASRGCTGVRRFVSSRTPDVAFHLSHEP